MSILVTKRPGVKRNPNASLLSEIVMAGNVRIDREATRAKYRVCCMDPSCEWKYELGEDVDPLIGVARARGHFKETGHRNIRIRFDLFDADYGPVALNTPDHESVVEGGER